MFILGISGVTCSGKTTLAKMLAERFTSSVRFCQDEYFLAEDDPRHIFIPELGHNNWELLTALDMERMREDVRKVLERKSISLLILEGYLLFRDDILSSYCNEKIYLDLTYTECKKRRSARIYDPPDVPGYFDKVVWPEGQKNRKIVMDQFSNINIMDGATAIDEIFKKVLDILGNNGFCETK